MYHRSLRHATGVPADYMRKTAETGRLPFWGFLAGETRLDDADNHRIYRPDGIDGWVLHCTTEGAGEVGRGSDAWVCRPGDMVLFAEGDVHDYGRLSGEHRWVHVWAHFIPRPSWREWMQWERMPGGAGRVRLGTPQTRRRIIARMEELVDYFRTRVRLREELCMNALEEVLLLCAETHGEGRRGALDERVARACAQMRDHYRSISDVAHLAAGSALSASRFAHLFREQTGVSPMRYLERIRISRAQELLVSSSLPVKSVAAECGYADALYFSHVFHRIVGRSPREFRKGVGR